MKLFVNRLDKTAENEDAMKIFHHVTAFYIGQNGSPKKSIFEWTIDVKKIAKKLKKSTSFVRSKLRLLAKNGLLVKDSYFYSPNWDNITKIFNNHAKAFVEFWSEDKKEQKEFINLTKGSEKPFSKQRVISIVTLYSYFFVRGMFTEPAISDILYNYLSGLNQCEIPENRQELKSTDKFFGSISKERRFAEEAENLPISWDEHDDVIGQTYGTNKARRRIQPNRSGGVSNTRSTKAYRKNALRGKGKTSSKVVKEVK